MIWIALILILIVGIGIVTFILQKKNMQPTEKVSMLAKDWNILYSKGLPPHPKQELQGWSFEFPKSPNSVHYVTTKYNGKAPRKVTMKFKIEASEDAKFVALDNISQKLPAIRFLLQKDEDNMVDDGYRWWSTTSAKLNSSVVNGILEAPVIYTQWSGLYGERSQTKLQAAIDNLGNVGFTFGAHFFGHGITLTQGTAKFILTDFIID